MKNITVNPEAIHLVKDDKVMIMLMDESTYVIELKDLSSEVFFLFASGMNTNEIWDTAYSAWDGSREEFEIQMKVFLNQMIEEKIFIHV